MQIPTRKSEQDRIALQSYDPHLTPRAIERLKKELAHLQASLPALKEELQTTASMGDFSENAGYQQAKANLRRANTRILTIEETLKLAVVIHPSSADTICLGSTVTLKERDETLTFTLVGAQEANPARGRLSHLSPLGKALLAHKVGDTVTLDTPSGVRELTIQSIT